MREASDFNDPASSISPSKRHLYTDPADCQCDGECPEGATGLPPPYMTLATDNRLYNITDNQFTTDEYLLRTYKEFIAHRLVEFHYLFIVIHLPHNSQYLE